MPLPDPRRSLGLPVSLALLVSAGCLGGIRETTTERSSAETLLLSTAAERALKHYDVSRWRGRRVDVDTRWLESYDRRYVQSCLRARLASGDARVGTWGRPPADPEVRIEVRAGTVGINDPEFLLGIPSLPFEYSGVAYQLPELQIGWDPQSSWVKLIVSAFDVRSHVLLDRQVLWGHAQTGWFEDIYPGFLRDLSEGNEDEGEDDEGNEDEGEGEGEGEDG